MPKQMISLVRTRKLQTNDGINLLIIEKMRDRAAKKSVRRASWTLGAGFGAAQEKICPDNNPVACWLSAGFRLKTLRENIPVADAVFASL
jgi:hypothetical protein